MPIGVELNANRNRDIRLIQLYVLPRVDIRRLDRQRDALDANDHRSPARL